MGERKADSEGAPRAAKRRPQSIISWTAADMSDYITASDERLSSVADAFIKEGLDGRATLQLSDEDLKVVAPEMKDRKHVQSLIADLSHPLFPAFVQMDADGSFTISEDELAHVLTRVSGEAVDPGKASSLIRMADVNHDSKIQFEEFKEIVSNSAPSDDWGKAAVAVGAPVALLAAGRAAATAVDDALVRVHSDLQAGAATPTLPGTKGYVFPTLLTRIVFAAFMTIPSVLGNIFSLGLLGLYEVLVLWPRGQTAAKWMMGSFYLDPKTGKAACFSQMLLRGVVAKAAATATWGVAIFVDWISGAADPNYQTWIDKLGGIILVYRKVDKPIPQGDGLSGLAMALVTIFYFGYMALVAVGIYVYVVQVSTHLGELFTQFDTDGDGLLDLKELEQLLTYWRRHTWYR